MIRLLPILEKSRSGSRSWSLHEATTRYFWSILLNIVTDIYLLWYYTRYEYHWADGKEIKKAIKVSANDYAKYLFEWVKKQLDDQTIFPIKSTFS